MNNKYIIKVGHPLLRPGLTIETEASESYLIKVVSTIMKNIRAINDLEKGTTLTGTGTIVTDSDDDTASYITTTDGVEKMFPDGTRKPMDPDMFKGNPDGAVE